MEKIKCAAIQLPNGSIFEGKNHGTIIQYIIKNIDKNSRIGKTQQGFITESGLFVDRKEALEIAINANQIINKHYPKDELLSEDLYGQEEDNI